MKSIYDAVSSFDLTTESLRIYMTSDLEQ